MSAELWSAASDHFTHDCSPSKHHPLQSENANVIPVEKQQGDGAVWDNSQAVRVPSAAGMATAEMRGNRHLREYVEDNIR